MEVILKNYRIYGQKRFLENVINDGSISRRRMGWIVEGLRTIPITVEKRTFQRQ